MALLEPKSHFSHQINQAQTLDVERNVNCARSMSKRHDLTPQEFQRTILRSNPALGHNTAHPQRRHTLAILLFGLALVCSASLPFKPVCHRAISPIQFGLFQSVQAINR